MVRPTCGVLTVLACAAAATADSTAAGFVPNEPPTIPEYWSTTGVQYISSADVPPPFPDNAGVPAPPCVAFVLLACAHDER